jgi:hypothetical protein
MNSSQKQIILGLLKTRTKDQINFLSFLLLSSIIKEVVKPK